jgi:hypothetical protein
MHENIKEKNENKLYAVKCFWPGLGKNQFSNRQADDDNGEEKRFLFFFERITIDDWNYYFVVVAINTH